jgi:peptidoglycan/LPS O-acetylase OafA/YrhL
VFFVISGFLITRQLFEEQQRSNRVSFSAFYARRARRILPAATLVTVATLLMAWRWASPLRVVSITKDGIAAALFGVNWRLAAAGTNYFNATAPPSPFQHYWSLSVEEQFYILWPVLLVAISLLFAKRFGRTKPLFAALGVVIVFSLWASMHYTSTNAPYAYFGTHTRAWELALGAVVAIGAHDLRRIPRRVATGLAWGGIAAIAAACFVLSSNTPYPGYAALLPVLGAVAVIIAGCGAATKWGPENAFLKRRLMQGGGKVSYSLYLWHWPLLILIPDALGHSLGTGQRFIVVGVALGLSILTFVFVEEPIRRMRSLVLQPRKAAMLGTALVATSIGVALIVSSAISVPGSNEPATNARQAAAINQLTAGSTTQTPAQLTAQLTSAAALTTLPANVTPSLAQAPTDAPNTKGCQVTQNVTSPKLPCNSFGDIHSKTQVVLIGDSHAGMWLDAISAIALAQHWRLTAIMKSGCSVGDYPALLSPISNQVFTQCNAWRPKMIADVKALHPALIIIGSEARDIAATDPNGLTSSINALNATGTKVAFLADTPSPRSVGDIPDCLATHLHDIQSCGIERADAGLTDPGRVAEIQGAQSAGATVIDPTSWMCTQLTCPAVIQNEIVYQDDSHITDSFALLRERPLGLALTAVMKG